jgi:phosphate:Na+ symporter
MARVLIFSLIGGLGLFFLGMKTMTDSLKHVAGDRLRRILELLTKKPVVGLLVGTVITTLVQSSSASTVMTVGFVNAGLLTLKQAISLILGANIGTTFTAWLVSFFALFKVTSYALPAIGIGFIMSQLGKTRTVRMWGRFILGFGMLFSGLGFMKDAFSPLRDSEALKNVLLTFGTYPVLGILVGIVLTILLQSSSATIALLQIMALSGLIDFQTCIPIILGDNIGTTITANIAAIGTNTASRRAARAHAIVNILGVCYMIIPVYTGLYSRLIEWIVPGPVSSGNIMLHIALAHSIFNIFNALVIFLPLISIVEKITVKLTPPKPGAVDIQPKYLEKHLLETPALALEQAIKEILRMIHLTREALQNSIKSFIGNDASLFKKVSDQEEAVNNFQREITQYLIRLSEKNLEPPEAATIPVLLHSVNDVERIGDHTINIIELAEQKINKACSFSPTAVEEIKQIADVVLNMFECTLTSLETRDMVCGQQGLDREEELNKLQGNGFGSALLNRLTAKFYLNPLFDAVSSLSEFLKNLVLFSLGARRIGKTLMNDFFAREKGTGFPCAIAYCYHDIKASFTELFDRLRSMMRDIDSHFLHYLDRMGINLRCLNAGAEGSIDIRIKRVQQTLRHLRAC